MKWIMKNKTKGGWKSSNGTNSVKTENGKLKTRFGRPNSLNNEEKEKLLEMYYSKPLSLRKLGDYFGVSRMTVLRTVQGAAGMASSLGGGYDG